MIASPLIEWWIDCITFFQKVFLTVSAPINVFIKLTDEAEMKNTDFAVCKPPETKSFSITGDGVKGTIPFLASQLLRQMLGV